MRAAELGLRPAADGAVPRFRERYARLGAPEGRAVDRLGHLGYRSGQPNSLPPPILDGARTTGEVAAWPGVLRGGWAQNGTAPRPSRSDRSRVYRQTPAVASDLSTETSIIDEITVDPHELILHPVRLRIIHAMDGGRAHTASDLCHRLTGVSKATVYRQVALLADNGVLDVVDERRVHGAMERRYRLSTSRAVTDPSVATNVPLDDHRKEFLAAVSVLISEFNRYLNGGHPNPLADFVAYRQFPLWLSREEVVGLVSTLTPYLRALAGNEPNPERRAYLFSPIFFPLEEEVRAAPGPGSARRKKPTTGP